MQDARSFLEATHVGVLSTLSPGHEIRAAAVYFTVDDGFTFYFITKKNTKKFENLYRNPHVALTVVDKNATQTVQAHGTASLVTDKKKASGIMAELVRIEGGGGAPWTAPIAQINAGDYVVVQMVPDWLRYADFSAQNGDGESRFEQIIPRA